MVAAGADLVHNNHVEAALLRALERALGRRSIGHVQPARKEVHERIRDQTAVRHPAAQDEQPQLAIVPAGGRHAARVQLHFMDVALVHQLVGLAAARLKHVRYRLELRENLVQVVDVAYAHGEGEDDGAGRFGQRLLV